MNKKTSINVINPLVSIGLPVWNGDLFLSTTLESLISQAYQNIEIIILDNLSTDNTEDICKSFAAKDSRIRYIRDHRNRSVIDGHKKVAELANGEFFMVVCDDDVYDVNYISNLLPIILSNPHVGLVYSNWAWINPEGVITKINWRWFMSKADGKFKNFSKYLFRRSPLPFCFGIIRTSVHKDALQYFIRPDNRGWNHDNLYMLRLLSNSLVESSRDVLFYYRQRDRHELYKKRGQLLIKTSFWEEHKKSVLHNLSYFKITDRIIENSTSFKKEKYLLKMISFFSIVYFIYISHLIHYIKNSIKNVWKRIKF
jgi:glycosyltransferase involved in cell wall biosynthesis